MCSFSRFRLPLPRLLLAIWTLALLLILPRSVRAQSNSPLLFPGRPFLPQFNPLCDGALVACLDADRFAGHAYVHGVVSPATDSRDTALSFPYGVSLGLFGRIAAGASTDFHVWRDADGLHNQHGPLRLSASALVWPLLPFDQSPQSGQDESGGSHFTFRRDLRVGIDFQQELRIGPFEGANALGLFGNLATLRLIASKGLGPLELIANGGALFDWQGMVSTGTISGQLGLHLPFFRALKVFVEGGIQGFGTRTERSEAVQRQGALGGGLAFRLRDRVDVGVDVLHGFGDVAKWTVLIRLMTLSVGESYQGRAATPVVELGADVTVEIVRQVREYIASLPIDPKLDETCMIRDDDGSLMGSYGTRSADGHFCEINGTRVPIGHDFYRPSKTKDLLCRDSAMTDCVLVKREGTWVGLRKVMLNEACRLIDLENHTTVTTLGERVGDTCRWLGERKNGRYAPIKEWNELPTGTQLYSDGASRVCVDPRLKNCVYVDAQLGWTKRNHGAIGVVKAADKFVQGSVQGVKQAATLIGDVATGRVSVASVYESAEDKAVKLCRYMLDGVKAVWNDPARFRECVSDQLDKTRADVKDFLAQPTGDQIERAAEAAATVGINVLTGVVGGQATGAALRGANEVGAVAKVAGVVEEVGKDGRKIKKLGKGAKGVGEHGDDLAARRGMKKAGHEHEEAGHRSRGRDDADGGTAEHNEPAYVPKAAFHEKTRSHILHGDVDPKTGKSHGWHYEPTGDASKGTKVIEGTRSAPDADGVYTGKVAIREMPKGPLSSFFPKDWTPDRIEKEVLEAYENRHPIPGYPNRFRGSSSSGMEIELLLEKNGRIQSAYPKYKGK